MSTERTRPFTAHRERGLRRTSLFLVALLLIEFTDELLFGVREAAWPLIRDDLRLSYTEVGLLLTVPSLVGNLVEPSFGILAHAGRGRALILGGGLLFVAATLLSGLSTSFILLLASSVLLNPASGAFVSLSQAALMDAEPERRERNMALWTLAGSIGTCIGPVAVVAAIGLQLSWRWLFIALAGLAALALAFAWRLPSHTLHTREPDDETNALAAGLREILSALRRREVVRWLVLLLFGDFTWDVLRGYLALYFVDVVGVYEGRAAWALIIWSLAGLPGDALLIPLLSRFDALKCLRFSTSVVLLLFPALLLVEGFALKVFVLGLLGFANAGWYAILQARLYAEMHARSGIALTLNNLFGLVGCLVPLALGAFAERFGLASMMWLLAIGPLVMFAGLMTAPAGERK